jgi:hypothetical protein
MSVVEAVQAEIDALNAPKGSLSATALAMAAEIDGENSATSKSMCAKVLVDTMERLRAAAPPEKREDGVDEIAKRRERRLRRATG